MNDALLARPLSLPCGAVLSNRIAKAAMTEGLADAQDRASDALCTLYRHWSNGGAGLLITGNVMVDRRFLERPGNVVVDGNGGDEALHRWAQVGTAAGNHLWMQISHVGRQCNRASGYRPLAPSNIGLDIGPLFRQPRAMSEEQIHDAISRYVRVALSAKQAGFTGVQIHAAHGYLISQFLSPRVNQRTDQWGGSLENRARFLLQIVHDVRSAVGADYPVGVKLNSADFQKGGFSDQESIRVARWLEREGIDLLEISGGSYEQPQFTGHEGLPASAAPPKRESTRLREAYFLRYAERIAAELDRLPLMLTGGFRSRQGMEQALDSGACQLIGLARPLCVVPNLPEQLISGQTERAESYENALNLGHGFFGPTSPTRLFRIINVQGEVAWFYRQIVRLSENREPKRDLGLIGALYQHLRNEHRAAKRRTFR